MWSARPSMKPQLNEIRTLHFIWKLDWVLVVIKLG
jgi:hypothetical protein